MFQKEKHKTLTNNRLPQAVGRGEEREEHDSANHRAEPSITYT